jgi:hypothetical protein
MGSTASAGPTPGSRQVRIEGKDVVTTVTEFVEHIPGDVGAQKSWLTNRRPRQWRDRIDVDVGDDPERSAAELRADLVQYLMDHGVRLALPAPVIDGEAEEVTNGVASIGANTAGRHGGNRGVVESIVRCPGQTGRANEDGSCGH